MEDNQIMNKEEIGNVRIADEVVSIIAGIATTEVKGVAGMSGGIAGGIAEILGKRNLSKGIKVEIKDKDTTVDLFVIVDYGCRIPEVAWDVQEKVKKSVENMTGLSVVKVNIHIQGVNFEKEQKKDSAPKDEESGKIK